MTFDVAIAGGGPAGLAVAIRAAQAGCSTVVLDRAKEAPDKACGEGIMPKGLRELSSLGALPLIAPGDQAPFAGIRFEQEDGSAVEGRFRDGHGLGVRRTALSAALVERARASGAELRFGCGVARHRTHAGAVELDTDAGTIEARLLVAADGLGSPLRRAAGLESTAHGPRRFGLRRHFRVAPWSDLVEVHWADGVEAYVTPAGRERVGVAFLWSSRERGSSSERTSSRERGDEIAEAEHVSFETLLRRFPRLAERLAGVPFDSEARGAGPMLRPVSRRVADRLALVGDAAGYVDAITGQGLGLAFAGAAALVRALPGALGTNATLTPALDAYDAAMRRSWYRYEIPARTLLLLSRHSALRRRALGLMSRVPRVFETLLAALE